MSRRYRSVHGPVPPIRSGVTRRMKPGGGSGMGGKVTSGPTFVSSGCTDATNVQKSHATAVAGVVGASTDNAQGIASLGWQTQVL